MKLELVLDEVDLPWSPSPEWQARLTAMISAVSARDATLQVVFTDDQTLREHNREYRGLDRPTDVLSFSYLQDHEDQASALLQEGADLDDYLDLPAVTGEERLAGQILISGETVCSRGCVHTGDLDQEMAFMVVHGLLHVLGFDHAGDDEARHMRSEETRMMGLLGHPAPGGEAG